MVDEKEMQQQYLQFQQLQQQTEQFTEHLELLNQQVAELDISVTALQEIEKTELNEEILAPLANGIFVRAALKDNQKMVINVGSNVTVEKTVSEVVKLLEEQKKQVVGKMIETEKFVQELQNQAMRIYQKIEEENAN